jgi:hypothetical protein
MTEQLPFKTSEYRRDELEREIKREKCIQNVNFLNLSSNRYTQFEKDPIVLSEDFVRNLKTALRIYIAINLQVV